jgi:porin
MLHIRHSNRHLACTFISALLVAQTCLAQSTTQQSDKALPIVATSLTVTGEIWNNASGGLRTGSHWNTLTDLTAEVDLSRLGGAANSSFTTEVFWIENEHNSPVFGQLTGAASPVSASHAADTLRVFNCFYRQSWGDGRYTLKIGQIACDSDFMLSDFSGLFTNAIFGPMPSQVATPHGAATAGNAWPVFDVASPGIHFRAQITEPLTVQFGVYHGGPGPDKSSNYGFDWRGGSGQGIVMFCEGDYTLQLAGKPSTFRAGSALHTGRFDNFTSLATDPDAGEVRGLYSFYLTQDIVLVAQDKDHPLLGAFWRAGLSPQEGRSIVHRYADAGINWFGPVPGRSDDILGLGVSYMEYGDAYRRLNPALAAAETAVELTYHAAITKHLSLQAVVQRLCNPATADDGKHHDSTVLGLRARLSF